MKKHIIFKYISLVVLVLVLSNCAGLKSVKKDKQVFKSELKKEFATLVKVYEQREKSKDTPPGIDKFRLVLEQDDFNGLDSRIANKVIVLESVNRQQPLFLDEVLKQIADETGLVYMEKSVLDEKKETVSVKYTTIEYVKPEKEGDDEEDIPDGFIKKTVEKTDKAVNIYYKSKFHKPLGISRIKGKLIDILNVIERVADVDIKVQNGIMIVKDNLIMSVEIPEYIVNDSDIVKTGISSNLDANDEDEEESDNSSETVNIVKNLEDVLKSIKGANVDIQYHEESSMFRVSANPNFFRENKDYIEEIINKSFGAGIVEVAVYAIDDELVRQLGIDLNIDNPGKATVSVLGPHLNFSDFLSTGTGIAANITQHKILGMNKVSVTSVIKALETLKIAKTINKYSLQVFNAKTSEFKSVRKVPYFVPGDVDVQPLTQSGGTTVQAPTTIGRPEVNSVDIGIVISLLPKVFPDKGYMLMDIDYLERELLGFETTLWTPVTDGSIAPIEIKYPITTEHYTSTVVRLLSGEPVLLTGLRKISDSTLKTLLGKTYIPLYTDKNASNSSVIIYIRGLVSDYTGVRDVVIK